jgi:Tol biopolymer transport system component
MVSSDGFVKVLDFGLAKLVEEKTGAGSGALTVAGQQTASGIVVGTVGYMSPEQASGAPLEFRSDQFALGSILYEMVTGRRAFARATAIDTLSAILHEEPEPVASLRPETPTALRWLLERCLAKEPDERYESTRDLARDLATLRDHLSEGSSSQAPSVRHRSRRALARLAVLLPAGAALVLAGLLLGRNLERKPPPTYRQLTFRQGTIRSARFSPDGQTVVYAAAWAGQPIEVFTVRPGAPESRPLGLTGANVLAVSPSGELAVLIRTAYMGLFPGTGTLARMPFEGGAAPREVLEGVSWADWSPDGSAMAVVRRSRAGQRLEYPVGKILYETSGWLSHPRISPDGRRVAFFEHPIPGDDRGSLALVDAGGKRRLGGSWSTAWGLAWEPRGEEVWFTAARVGSRRELRARSISGKERLIARLMTDLSLHDIARDGRVLLAHDTRRFGTLALPPGAKEERELSWLDLGLVTDISRDGRRIALNESGEGGGEGYSVYLRGTDGSPAIRLGPGRAARFSPDEKWVLTADIRTEPPQLVLLPTGPGEPVSVTKDRLHHWGGQFLPDGKRIVFTAGETGGQRRLYVQPISGGAPSAISPEGVWNAGPVSPDGQFVASQDAEDRMVIYPTSPGEARRAPGMASLERPTQWSPDGKSLYVFRRGELPARVFRVDVDSGRRELWKTFAPSDPTGVVEIQWITMTPDAATYAYTYRPNTLGALRGGGIEVTLMISDFESRICPSPTPG